MKKYFLGVSIILGLVGFFYALSRSGPSGEYKADNIILGIRGFKHDQLFASGGATEKYEVGLSEEFKVLWIVHVLEKDGTVTWKGPAGVGEGSAELKAGEEVSDWRAFTVSQPGTAEFTLTASGPGNNVPEINKITVTIK